MSDEWDEREQAELYEMELDEERADHREEVAALKDRITALEEGLRRIQRMGPKNSSREPYIQRIHEIVAALLEKGSTR